MGPIALFDKSFLQALSVDESVWFDCFFYPNICPLFYVETLADLGKALKPGRKAEHEVASIAEKSPQLHGGPNVFHGDLCVADLMGQPISMARRIVAGGGRRVRVDGKPGVVYEASPESQAFSRWQDGRFFAVEYQFARTWRKAVAEVDLKGAAKHFRALGIDSKSCRTLEDAKNKKLSTEVVSASTRGLQRLLLCMSRLGVPNRLQRQILQAWKEKGCPTLVEYTSYAAYVATVDLFFHAAIAARLIGEERPSNRVDVA